MGLFTESPSEFNKRLTLHTIAPTPSPRTLLQIRSLAHRLSVVVESVATHPDQRFLLLWRVIYGRYGGSTALEADTGLTG